MPQNGVHLDGAEVKRRREAMFLTQPQFAAKLAITPATLSLIEADPEYRTSFKTLQALAREFDCLPGALARKPEEVAS